MTDQEERTRGDVVREHAKVLAERDRGLDLAKALCGSRDIDEAFAVVEAWVQEADRYRAALEEITTHNGPEGDGCDGSCAVDMWTVARHALDPTEEGERA